MRVLVIGGGGREHALAWKLRQSPLVEKLWCAPGNAGTAVAADTVDIAGEDIGALTDFARANGVDLAVVGPEAPLAAGIADRFEEARIRCFGPSAAAAQIEASKAFAKELMQAAGIPTATHETVTTPEAACKAIESRYAALGPGGRVVLKADGLAAGKGVVVAASENEAREAAVNMMVRRVFGSSGDRLVIEECLEGEEASIMALCDGETVIPLAPAQDHKRVFDGDQGPNTGGMGAYTPVPALSDAMLAEALETIVRPAVKELARRGTPFRGILYAGIMITSDGLKTIEFNCRFGDPETQTVLPLMESDLAELLYAACENGLADRDVRWSGGASVCVTASSGGYPGAYRTGIPIDGLDAAAAEPGCVLFHSGTRREGGRVVTAGGRVLSVTGQGADLAAAAERAYAGLAHITFDGCHYRRDIAQRGLRRCVPQ